MTNVVSRGDCREIARLMRLCFKWDSAPEGEDFWFTVHTRFDDWGCSGDPQSSLVQAPPRPLETALLEQQFKLLEENKERINALQLQVEAQELQLANLRRKLLQAEFASLPRGLPKFS